MRSCRDVNRTTKHIAFFTAIVLFGGSALAAALAFAVPATRALTFGTTSNGAITPVLTALEQRSVIVDRNGKTMATLYATEDRAPITLKGVSPGVISAVVSIQDRTFYSHRGVDPKSILPPLFNDARPGGVPPARSPRPPYLPLPPPRRSSLPIPPPPRCVSAPRPAR